ncbi:MAG: ComEC/Rec2 family competence protein [Microbacterium sp.]|nr:ComEC/Rec2 family competence protein [Microbacterium sp.]
MRGDLRMLVVAGAAWCTALLCVFVVDAAWWCVLGAVLWAAAIAVVATSRTRADGVGRRFAVVAGAGGLAIVALSTAGAVALGVAVAGPSRGETASWDGRVVELTGTIVSSASPGRDGRLWIDVQLTALGAPGRQTRVSAPVRIGVPPASGFEPGADVLVTGEAKATDAGERAVLVVFARRAEVRRPAAGVFAVAAELRNGFADRTARLPTPGAELLPGLAVGDTRAVSPELDDAMRASGLSHLTAVSGANCAIVVGAAFWLTAVCGGGRRMRVVVAAVSLAGFVVIVTPEPSVVRAAVMAGVAMLTVLLGRPRAGPGMLALCATGILLVDPWLAATPGFALSVAASGALILLARPLADGLQRVVPRPLALAVGVPLAAQLVCAPIIALFAEQQSLIGVVANMIADPAAPIATVIGLLACLAAPVPLVADALTAAAWLPSAWIAATAGVTAGLPMAEASLVPGIGSAVLVAVLSVSAALVVIRSAGPALVLRMPVGPLSRLARSLVRFLRFPVRRGRVRRGRVLRIPVLRVLGAGVLLVVVALGAAQALLAGPLATAANPDRWAIAACDVGQGDALVVRSSGHAALIDTGPDPRTLEECMRELGIDRIDVLVLTHFDLDHIGGTDAVRGRVGIVLHGPPDDAEATRLLDGLREGGAQLRDAEAGLHGTLGAAAWRVRWPTRSAASSGAGNDSSVVIEVEGGGVPRSVFLGDLSAESQRMLARTPATGGGYDVVKVAHHGSADQDAGLYDLLRPRVALISVGEGNDYGHPRREALALLDATGARVLRTDQRGRILVGLRDGTLAVWTERGE